MATTLSVSTTTNLVSVSTTPNLITVNTTAASGSTSVGSLTVTTALDITATHLDYGVLRVIGESSGTTYIASLAAPTNNYHTITLIGQSNTNLVGLLTTTLASDLYADMNIVLGAGDHVILQYMNPITKWVVMGYRRVSV